MRTNEAKVRYVTLFRIKLRDNFPPLCAGLSQKSVGVQSERTIDVALLQSGKVLSSEFDGWFGVDVMKLGKK